MLKVNETMLGEGYSARDASIVALVLSDYGHEAEYGTPENQDEMPDADDLQMAIEELPEMKEIIAAMQDAAEYVEEIVAYLP